MFLQVYINLFIVFSCNVMLANAQQEPGICPYYTDPNTGFGSNVGCSDCQYCPDGSRCNLCNEPTSRPTDQSEPVMGKCPVWYDQLGQKVQIYCAGCQYCPDGSFCNECTTFPSNEPTTIPSSQPSAKPSLSPSSEPSVVHSSQPSAQPTTSQPSVEPTIQPSTPTVEPSNFPSAEPFQSNTPVGLPTTQPSQEQAIISDTKTPTIQPSQQPVTDSTTLRSNSSTSTMASGAVGGIAASLFVVICVCLPVLYLLCCVSGAAGGKDEEGKQPGEGSSKPTYYFDYERNAGMSAMAAGNNGCGDDAEKPYNDAATEGDASEVGAQKDVGSNKRANRRGSSVSTGFAPITHNNMNNNKNNNPMRKSPATESDYSHAGDKNLAPSGNSSMSGGVYHNSYFQGSDSNNHTPSEDEFSSSEENDSELPAAESARSTTGLIRDGYTV